MNFELSSLSLFHGGVKFMNFLQKRNENKLTVQNLSPTIQDKFISIWSNSAFVPDWNVMPKISLCVQ